STASEPPTDFAWVSVTFLKSPSCLVSAFHNSSTLAAGIFSFMVASKSLVAAAKSFFTIASRTARALALRSTSEEVASKARMAQAAWCIRFLHSDGRLRRDCTDFRTTGHGSQTWRSSVLPRLRKKCEKRGFDRRVGQR